MKKFIKKVFDILAFIFCVKGNTIEKEAIWENIVSREGQGRDRFGN